MSASGVMSWGAETGLIVSLLVIAILLIRKPFSRLFGAGPTYALWSLPLIRLCLPVITVPKSWMPNWIMKFGSRKDTVSSNPGSLNNVDRAGDIVTSAGQSDIQFHALLPELNTTSFDWPIIIIGFWLGVRILWIFIQLERQRRFSKDMRATSHPIANVLEEEAARAAKTIGLKKLPEIKVSSQNTGPFVTGVMRPIVILPKNFQQSFDHGQRQYALAHELAHVKRYDLWVALVALIFRAVNWFNPLVVLGMNKMRVDQEAACDDFVMRKTHASNDQRVTYAKTLLHAAKIGGAPTGSAKLALSLMEERFCDMHERGDENA